MTAGQLWIGIATIIALLVGPFLAIQVDKRLQEIRDQRNRKLDVFRRLLITRAAFLAVNHIDALNLIEAEFDSRKGSDKPVLDRWHEYWDHLNTKHDGTAAAIQEWERARAALLVELLWTMSEYLKLGIDRSVLKRASYYPEYYGNIETENAALRKAAIAVFQGKSNLKVQLSEEQNEVQG